jgi:hypothetical protein
VSLRSDPLQGTQLLVMQFSPPNILLSTLSSNTLSLRFCHILRDKFAPRCRQQTRGEKALDRMVADITKMPSPFNFLLNQTSIRCLVPKYVSSTTLSNDLFVILRYNFALHSGDEISTNAIIYVYFCTSLPELMAVGKCCADHATHSTRNSRY